MFDYDDDFDAASRREDPALQAKFQYLCDLEPRLADLHKRVEAIADTTSPVFCAQSFWYGEAGKGGIKSELKRLVGYGAGYPPPTPDTLGVGAHLEQQAKEMPLFISAKDLMQKIAERGERVPGFPPELTTSDAYEVAYDFLYGLLPDCRNCSCA